MTRHFAMALASILLVASFFSGVLASPALLNAFVTNPPPNHTESLGSSGQSSLTNRGLEISLIPLTGIANPPTPADVIGGSVYTTVMLRSGELYNFPFIFNPVGSFQKINRVDLWILSGDCYTCADRIGFTYTINGVPNSASMQFPGTSAQGPVTNIVTLPTNAITALTPGSNQFTITLTRATILATGQVLTGFPFGSYQVALFIDYQTIG